MPPRPRSFPTEAELEILQVLWERGPSTVRDIYSVLSEDRDFAYTTVLKLMQIMFEKGSISRNASQRSHRYTAALKRDQTQRTIVKHVITTVFSGSASGLAECAIAHARSSRSELAKIRALLAPAKASRVK